jgi:formylmethanofuran dehydrogenase subunit E
MAGCELTAYQIERAVEFHGHWCPGLAIGLRASEYVLKHIGRAEDEEIVAVVETDMCGVDAIQVLTGCTFGKGNLLLRDHGKMAFSFFRRSDSRGMRLVFNRAKLDPLDDEFTELNQKSLQGELDPMEETRLANLHQEHCQYIMSAPFEELFKLKLPDFPMPRPARILASLTCEECGESVMESRTRRLEGRTLCMACFEARDNWL